MKIACLFLLAAFAALPAAANPITYDITFSGVEVYYSSATPVPSVFPPETFPFTYDPNSGFSNFVVNLGGNVFDFTAGANAPVTCFFPGVDCTVGSHADGLQILMDGNFWGAGIVFGQNVFLDLDIAIATTGTTASLIGYPGAAAIQGTYTVSATPEPRTLQTACLAVLIFSCLYIFRSMRL